MYICFKNVEILKTLLNSPLQVTLSTFRANVKGFLLLYIMIITIEGKKGCGKNYTAEEIVKGCGYILITESDMLNPFFTGRISETTEYVIIDDVQNYEKVRTFFNKDEIEIIRRGEPSYMDEMPHIIIIKKSN